MSRKTAIILLAILAILVIGFVLRDTLFGERPGADTDPAGEHVNGEDLNGDPATQDEPAPIDPVAELSDGLRIPWEIAFLPDGDILVTERPGTLRRLGEHSAQYTIPDVHHHGEGGLLGMALHPDFERNNYLYLYQTVSTGGRIINRVYRFTFTDDGPTARTLIFDNIPGARFHNGGRIAFGPDGYLYITTGDAEVPSLSQDPGSLAGKILRIADDGSIPADNPFGTAVYSYGHRNPQGLAWDSGGRLWSTEHGAVGNDEINLIAAGNNYGWPVIEGDAARAGMETPVLHSTRTDTWAPAGMTILDDVIYFGGLRGQSLYAAAIHNGQLALTPHINEEYGRIRAVGARNGYLYFTTSNRDGRGQIVEGDDKIIRIHPSLLE
jgi:glucose/arabinose dehydrogenase